MRWNRFITIAAITIGIALVPFVSAGNEETYMTYGIHDIEATSPINYNQSVNIDIEPGVCPNALSLNRQGLLPIAVLGTKDFDVTTINASTIVLTSENSTDEVSPFRWHYDDAAIPANESGDCICQQAGQDSFNDLILEFDIYKINRLLDLQRDTGKEVVLTLKGILKGNESDRGITGIDCTIVST